MTNHSLIYTSIIQLKLTLQQHRPITTYFISTSTNHSSLYINNDQSQLTLHRQQPTQSNFTLTKAVSNFTMNTG